MEYRTFGKTGLRVSVLGFGCGAVGGLLVKGSEAEMQAAVAHAIDAGINYFDTAQAYGNGASEHNLGAVLKSLGAAAHSKVIVGSKVQLKGPDFDDIEGAIIAAAEVSLRRLQRESLDLYQLHNAIAAQRQTERGWVGLADLDAVARAFGKLQAQGKIKHWGINGLGESEALLSAVEIPGPASIQICYNLLNPSAGLAVPSQFAFQDYRGLMRQAAEASMGVIGIRVMAGGALAGTAQRHPFAAQSVAPIASGGSFDEDVALSQRFAALLREGWAQSLPEAALRFAISQPMLSTALIGLSSFEQLQQALAAVERGPLPTEALAQVPVIVSSRL